jgi:hypothetical protein
MQPLNKLKNSDRTARKLRDQINILTAELKRVRQISAHGPGIRTFSGVNGTQICIPRQYVPDTRILFGKPTGAFSTGATITLDPCDIHGTDNGKANATVYVQPSQASYSMTNSTTIPVTAICPYVLGSDGSYYLLGTPIEIVTDVDVTSTVMTKKTRNVWILTVGTESAAVTIDTFTTSCP